MKVNIPLNLFIFIWCLVGIIILGYDIIQMIYYDKLVMSSHLANQLFWFIFFIYYTFNYILSKRNNEA
jgi:hypothetical protein